MAAPGRKTFYIAPMLMVENAAKVAYHQQYIQRQRDKAYAQPSSDVLDNAWRERFEAERTAGVPSTVTLWDAVQRYCGTVIHKIKKPNRFRHIRNDYLRILEYLGRDTLVHKVTRSKLLKYRDLLLEKGLKVNSVNRYMSSLNTLLKCCKETWGLIDEAPYIKALPNKKRKFTFLTELQEQRLLAAAPPHLWRFLVFILGTGARKSEAVGLTWDDVFFKEDGRSWVRFPETKTGRPHSVPLPTHITEMLKEMELQRHQETGFVFTYVPTQDCRRADGQIFLRAGVPAHFRWPDRDFDVARRRSGVRNITIHGLRHTYASRLIMKGVGVFDVARLLNHASLESTMQYIHLNPSYLEGAVQHLDQAYNGAPAEKRKRTALTAGRTSIRVPGERSFRPRPTP